MSTALPVDMGFRQRNASSPFFFLPYVLRRIQKTNSEQSLLTDDHNILRILGFVYDLDVIEYSLLDKVNALGILKRAASKADLNLNASKVKVMEFIDHGVDSLQREELIFEKLKEFKHLSATMNIKNV